MMSTKKILTALLVASLAGNASFLITTFIKRPSHDAGVVNQLELTKEQSAQFAGAKQSFQAQRTQAQQKLAALRSVLADEFTKASPDRQKLLATATGMVEIQAAMRPRMMDHLLALHALLTPTQRATFATLMRTGGGNGVACPGAMLYPTRNEER